MWNKHAKILSLGCLLLGLALGLFSTACGGPVITERSFAGRCLTYSPGDNDNGCSCGEQPQICDQFEAVIAVQYPGQQACINACTSLQSTLYQRHPVDCCRSTVRYAWQNCNNFCRVTYPQ